MLSGITAIQSCGDTEVISGLKSKVLKYVNLGLKSLKTVIASAGGPNMVL